MLPCGAAEDKRSRQRVSTALCSLLEPEASGALDSSKWRGAPGAVVHDDDDGQRVHNGLVGGRAVKVATVARQPRHREEHLPRLALRVCQRVGEKHSESS